MLHFENPEFGDVTLELQAWADKYCAQIDEELTNGWPDMADRIEQVIDDMSIWQLAQGPTQEFFERRLDPIAKSWVQRYVQPVLEAADNEFRCIVANATERRISLPAASGDGLSEAIMAWRASWRSRFERWSEPDRKWRHE